ncbi:MAG: PQQ-dependent sugar dehydrogenase, partial [Phycisphaerae bacterium]
GHTTGTGNGQDITSNLLGKMLRIDVNGDDFPGDPNRNYVIPPDNPFVGISGDDEIWAYGLRNPWRSAFDAANGNLWIADVGQNAWEEVDFQVANAPGSMPGDPGYQGGINYGWRCREGAHNFNFAAFCAALTLIDPIHEYSHGAGCSITGGEVYRGCSAPNLGGTYFFADFCSNSIWSMRFNGLAVTNFTDRTLELIPDIGSIGSISSFGTDVYGELYICDLGGEVFKVQTVAPVFDAADVDGSRMVDIDDATTLANVLLENGVFDVCTLQRADVNSDGKRDGADIQAWLGAL